MWCGLKVSSKIWQTLKRVGVCVCVVRLCWRTVLSPVWSLEVQWEKRTSPVASCQHQGGRNLHQHQVSVTPEQSSWILDFQLTNSSWNTVISTVCCQSSCFRWSSGGEWERSSKAVDCWQRVKRFFCLEGKLFADSSYRYWYYLSEVKLNVKWHYAPSGCRRSGKKTTTCTSMPSRHGDGASSPPTRGWCCMQTERGWSSQTSEWDTLVLHVDSHLVLWSSSSPSCICPLHSFLSRLSLSPSRWILPSVTLCFVSATLQGVVVGRDSFCPDIWEMSTPSTTSSALRYKQTHR